MRAKARIQIVDDESFIAYGIQNTLNSLRDAFSSVAASGEEALKKAEEKITN